MPMVQKDLIQKDKEMTQVKCERYYEWGSAPGKFLVRDQSGKDDVSPKLGISAQGKFLVTDPSGKGDVSPKLRISASGNFLVRDPSGKGDVNQKLGIIVAQSILSLFILLL